MKIAVLTDTHYGDPSVLPERRCHIGDILLMRAVHRLNRLIKPDVTVLLGDLLDDGFGTKAPVFRKRLRDIVALIQSPTIVLPGNHDGDVGAFYQDFERPAATVDIGGVRFLPFIDPEEPEFNARRTERDLARMRSARNGHDGMVVSLQHVPLFPPGMSDCPYNYTNATAVIAEMRQAGIGLAISGHYHRDSQHIRDGSTSFVTVPALAESPFSFAVVVLDGDKVSVVRHDLAMPRELELFDCHVHTPFAYCSQDMHLAAAVTLAQDFALAGMAFAEHSGHLYFGERAYWSGDWLANGIDAARAAEDRVPQYLAQARAAAGDFARVGLEVDCDARGRPVVRPEDRRWLQMTIGGIHLLPALRQTRPDLARAGDEYLAMLSGLLASGVQILAHPFRVFGRHHQQVPRALFAPTVKMLREYGVAAELNFHGENRPQSEFVSLCLEAGVKLALGSDAHALYEVGEFAPHLQFLADCGYDGDLRDILRAEFGAE